MDCPDCNGKGKYILLYTCSDCESCDGTGEMDPEKISEFAPIHVDDVDTEPLFELALFGTPIPMPPADDDKCEP